MTILASSTMADIGVVDASIVALLGYAVVFFGLILLMGLVIAMGRIFISMDRKAAAKAAAQLAAMPAPAPVEATAPVVEAAPVPTAPGSAGGIKLHNVEPKTAAMLMAIVADKMGKPLNELRFISVKEVE